MRLHETIRARRIELGMTQDQLARQVGVSAPAVNKWEKAASYPDITLLPVLARTLGLDMNALLDFHRDLSREEVAAFVNALAEAAGEQGVEQAFQLTRDKLREYPGNDLLALSAAQVLDGALHLWPYLVASAHFQLAVAEKDAPAALAALGQMLRGLTEPWTLQDSPLYRHIPVKEGAGEARSMMLRPLLESLEKDPACGFLHPLPEYQALLGEYLRGTE